MARPGAFSLTSVSPARNISVLRQTGRLFLASHRRRPWLGRFGRRGEGQHVDLHAKKFHCGWFIPLDKDVVSVEWSRPSGLSGQEANSEEFFRNELIHHPKFPGRIPEMTWLRRCMLSQLLYRCGSAERVHPVLAMRTVSSTYFPRLRSTMRESGSSRAASP